ncbi:MAG: hypothetical protein ACFFD2_21680 [Promethearchaeota archaeon]
MNDIQKFLEKIQIPVEETGLAGLLTPEDQVLYTGTSKMRYRLNTEKVLDWTSPYILTDKGVAFVYVRKNGTQQKLYFTLDEITYTDDFGTTTLKHDGRDVTFLSFPGGFEYRELIVQRKREYIDYIRQHMDNKEIYKKKNEKRQLIQIAQMVKDIEKEKRRYAKREAKRQRKMNK